MAGKISLRGWIPSRTSKKSPPAVTSTSTSSSTINTTPSTSAIPVPPSTSAIAANLQDVERTGLIHLNKDTPIPDTYIEGTFPIDIIAVHGINGGPYSTWKHQNGTFWLRDLLTKELPGARVYSFGYSAKVFLSLDTGGFEDFARELLEDIRVERSTPALQRRPIIFICHSMGGIVVKKALNITTVDSARYSNIISSTHSILFLATPHGGSSSADIAIIAKNILSIPLMGRLPGFRSDLIASLKSNSKELQTIARDFRHLTRNIKIFSFIEQVKIVGLSDLIVDQKSGSMNVDTENVLSMGGCDHRTICRFESVDSLGYKRVSAIFKEVAVEVTNKAHAELLEEDWPCLQSFSFPSIQQRTAEHMHHRSSCNWLLEHPTYRHFISSPLGSPLLLLKGHPGSGKSTLMAFLHSTYSKLPSHAQNICLDFFFNGNGNMLQRSKLGMLRALLWQMYQQSVDARNIIFAKWKQKEAALGPGWTWVVDEVSDLLIEVLHRQRREVLLFIDAVDEAVDESGMKVGMDILAYLCLVNTGVKSAGGIIRICASCRHYPVHTAGSDTLEIIVEESNGLDLANFVHSQLQNGVDGWNNFPELERKDLEDAVSRKADGIFLWAKLRLRKIVKSLNDGAYEMVELSALIEKESNELFAIYESILENDVDSALKERAFLLMQWVCLAERPLRIEELRYAMACDNLTDDGQKMCEDVVGFVQSDERMEKLLRSLSGGLAILVASGEHNHIVQLFHATVYDFLRDRGLMLLSRLHGLSVAATDSSDEIIGSSQDRLSKSCLKYLRQEQLLETASRDCKVTIKDHSFIQYATKNWLAHAERAERHGIGQEDIIQILETQPKLFEVWKMLYNAIDRRDLRCPAQYIFDPIHVASHWNLQTMMLALLHKGIKVDETDYNGWTALHHACYFGYYQLVEILIENGAGIAVQTSGLKTPLELAAANSHEEIVRLLLKKGANINEKTGDSGNALQAAAEKGNARLIKLLIRNGASIDSEGGHYGNALKQAASGGNLEIVKLLLSYNANVNQEGGCYGTALHSAVAIVPKGRKEHQQQIIDLLLDAGANPNIVGCDLGNAFQAAAHRGNLRLVKLFLKHGVDINASDGEYGSALHAAAASNDEETVEFLLGCGADVNKTGGLYLNALQAAAHCGSTNLVQVLLDKGAQVNAVGGMYGTALQAGAASPGPEVVHILLEAGADVDVKCSTGGYYGNVLQAAVYAANYDLAKLALSWGFDVNKQGGQFSSVLQAAVVQCSPGFISFLLGIGADPNVVGGQYGSPLQAAVVLQRTVIVQALLENGADVNAVASDGTFALQTAARGGNIAIIKLLLDSGADVNLRTGGWRGTALHEAINAEEREVALLLLERGAKMDIKAGFWNNAFEAGMSSMNMTNLLLDRTTLTGHECNSQGICR